MLEQGPATTGKVAIAEQENQEETVPKRPRRESSTTALKVAAEKRELNHYT